MSDLESERQEAFCARFGVQPVRAPAFSQVGIAFNVREGLQPIKGLRTKPEGDTNGWYISAVEEWSDDPQFFAPLHIEHLEIWCPQAIPYLQLPPGWRFLVAPGHEDVGRPGTPQVVQRYQRHHQTALTTLGLQITGPDGRKMRGTAAKPTHAKTGAHGREADARNPICRFSLPVLLGSIF
jgi:hypothetical protein